MDDVGPADEPGPAVEPGATNEPSEPSPAGFNPPPPEEGYTRIVAPVVVDLEPGADVMFCQYVHDGFDRDMDILDIMGYQSATGHHSVAYSTTATLPLGTNRACEGEDNLSGAFLGGTGGEAGGSGAALPEGVAFRLRAGSRIMLNTHFLNTTEGVVDGESVLDVKFVEVDPARLIASMFVNINLGFDIPPMAPAEAIAECVMPSDFEFILFTNHMHDFGRHAMTEVIRAGGGVTELVHEDPVWSYEMQFNADYSEWSVDQPLLLRAGDTLKTYCSWENTSPENVAFPREMCLGLGFFLSDGASAPVCMNGSWRE